MPITHEVRGGVLIVTVDNPPVNALPQVERRGLSDVLTRAAHRSIRAVVICGANSSFIAAADVRATDSRGTGADRFTMRTRPSADRR
jgi:3-hydroxyacyl-CoA dehydrogenase